MTENVQNLLTEILRKMQADSAETHRQLKEVISRLGAIEKGMARINTDVASNYSEIIHDRHRVDLLIERIERIEKRLEIAG